MCLDPLRRTQQGLPVRAHALGKAHPLLGVSELELSTNLAENSMRPVALGRKNWNHIGSPQAGPKVAAILSVVGKLPQVETPSAGLLGPRSPRVCRSPDPAPPRPYSRCVGLPGVRRLTAGLLACKRFFAKHRGVCGRATNHPESLHLLPPARGTIIARTHVASLWHQTRAV